MTDPPPQPPEPAPAPASPTDAQPHGTRQHFVQCPKHGRVYDASKAAGCSQCLAEGTTADAPAAAAAPVPQGKQGLPQGVLLGLLLLLLGIIVVPRLLQNRGGGDTAATPGEPAAAAAPRVGAGGDDDISRSRPRPSRFDPGVYEAPLRALETALYETPETDPYNAAGRADGASRALIAQVLARNTRSLVAQDFMKAMEATMSRLGSSGEGGYVLPDFYGARGNWERIRREYFQNAPWYHAPMAPPAAAAAGAAPAPAPEDPTAFRRASAFAADLERIINTYRSTIMGFPDPGERMTSGQAQRVENDYRTFVQRWNDELDGASRLGPEGWYRVGRATAGRLQRATDQLTTAFNLLREVVPPARIPYRGQRSGTLARAENAIATAKRIIAAQPAATP
jgi:hypothetical protein